MVLVTKRPIRFSRRLVDAEPELLDATMKLVCSLADTTRFPWLKRARKPRDSEVKLAIRATAAMHAFQRLQTERRSYGKRVEAELATRLVSMGYQKIKTPNKGRITAPVHFPSSGQFYGVCKVYGRETDLFIALADGRVAAVEAKDSSSVVNSVKRVLNDTAAKAEHWDRHAGMTIVPIALLSGVFGVKDLQRAQDAGLFLVWLHNMSAIEGWLRVVGIE
jgi:XamI restriction endonuclease